MEKQDTTAGSRSEGRWRRGLRQMSRWEQPVGVVADGRRGFCYCVLLDDT